MVYLLIENPDERTNFEFITENDDSPISLFFPAKKCNSMGDIIRLCNDCLRDTDNGDIVVCWYDFIGVVLWMLAHIRRKKRYIVVLNILLKDKKTIKNKAVKKLYKHALISPNVEATVTSKKYGDYLNRMLGINIRYTLLHDIYHEGYSREYSGSITSNSVFCGGRNGRDWELLFNIAKELPDVQFNCVLTKDMFDQYQDRIGKNINAKHDIPETEFIEMLCQSQLVAMPLDTNAPAGLIAFYQAAANGKLIITTHTPVTVEYFSDHRGVLCQSNIEEWKEAIRYYLANELERKKIAASFKDFLQSECSEECYAKTLTSLLEKIERNGE